MDPLSYKSKPVTSRSAAPAPNSITSVVRSLIGSSGVPSAAPVCTMKNSNLCDPSLVSSIVNISEASFPPSSSAVTSTSISSPSSSVLSSSMTTCSIPPKNLLPWSSAEVSIVTSCALALCSGILTMPTTAKMLATSIATKNKLSGCFVSILGTTLGTVHNIYYIKLMNELSTISHEAN